MGSIGKVGRIRFEAEGPEGGLPLVALHGFGFDHRMMQAALEPAVVVAGVGQSLRRIYVDLPGHGQSRGLLERASSDLILEDLTSFLRETVGDSPFLLSGESYGGYLALGLLDLFGRQTVGACLLCPLVVANRRRRHLEPHVVLERDEEALGALTQIERDSFLQMAVLATSGPLARWRRDVAPGLGSYDHDFVHEVNAHYELSRDPLESGAVRGFAGPALICCGRQDSVVGWRDQADLALGMPHASFVVRDRAGHNLQLEHPAMWTSLASDWLREVLGER